MTGHGQAFDTQTVAINQGGKYCPRSLTQPTELDGHPARESAAFLQVHNLNQWRECYPFSHAACQFQKTRLPARVPPRNLSFRLFY